MEQKKKKKLPIIIGAAIVAVIAIIILVIALGGHRVIKINSTVGTVSLDRNSSDKEIVNGMNLKSGDKVTTGQDGLVELLVDEDKHILAKENTRFKIISKGDENKGKLKIKLEYGSTLIGIDSKLEDGQEVELETPNASLSVRGTTFKVDYNPDEEKTVVSVAEGVVRVSTPSETKDVEAGQQATVVKEGDIVIESIYPYNDVARFEVLTYSGEPSGVFVKDLVGWERLDDGYRCGYKNNNEQMFFAVCTEAEFMESIEWIAESGSAKTEIEYINNADGDEVICVYYYQQDSERNVCEYSFFRKIDEEKGIAIDVICGDSEYYDFDLYLPLTMERYYIIGDDKPEEEITEEVEEEIDLNLEDITYIASGDEVLFYLRNINTGKDTDIGVKEIVGWEYMHGNHPELIVKRGTSTVNLRYECFSEQTYKDMPLVKESLGYTTSTLVNDDGDEIVCFQQTLVANERTSVYYIYAKALPGNIYMSIEVLYCPSDGEKAQVDEYTYLALTNNEYFEFPETVVPEELVGTEITDDQIPTIFRGEVNREQLEYLLDVAETCRFADNENYIATGLDILWYMYYTDVVIPYEGSISTHYTYDIETLNNMFSVLSDDRISASNIPDVATISGDKLVFEHCDITMGGGVKTTIVKIIETGNGELVVEYNFKKSYGSDGAQGINGTSRAYFKQDASGKYKFDHIVEISSEEYSYY